VIKRFTIEINDSLLGIGVKASVGISRDPKFKIQIHKKLLEVSEIVSISEVTGRFDIMIRVYTQDLEDLHTVVIEKIGKIDKIILLGDYAKGIDNGLIEVLIVGKKIDREYLEKIKPKIEKEINRKVNFMVSSTGTFQPGLVVFES